MALSEANGLKEFVEPNSPHIAIVQHHKIRWLSLADCVTVLVEIIRDSKNKYFFQRSRIIMVEISRS